MALFKGFKEAKGQGQFGKGEWFTAGGYVAELQSLTAFDSKKDGKSYVKATFTVLEVTRVHDDNTLAEGAVATVLFDETRQGAADELKTLVGCIVGYDTDAEEGDEGFATNKQWCDALEAAIEGEGRSCEGAIVVIDGIRKMSKKGTEYTKLYYSAPEEVVTATVREDRASA